MQVTPEPTTLLLPRGDQPFPRALNLPRQLHGMSGDTNLPGQVLQEAKIVGPEGITGCARCERELPNRLCLVDKREVNQIPARSAQRGPDTECLSFMESDRDVREL